MNLNNYTIPKIPLMINTIKFDKTIFILSIIPIILWFFGLFSFENDINTYIGITIILIMGIMTSVIGSSARLISIFLILVTGVLLIKEGSNNDMFKNLYPYFICVFVSYYGILNIINWRKNR